MYAARALRLRSWWLNRHAIVRAAHVLCADSLHADGLQYLAQRGHTVVEISPDRTEAWQAALAACHALVVRSSVQVTADVLRRAPHLRVVARAGTGLDNVDVGAATKQGIMVMNTPGGSTQSAAELTLALLMALAARGGGPEASHSAVLRGKTVGIIGVGRIGMRVASWCHGAGMRVLGFDPLLSSEVTQAAHIEQLPLPELFAAADFITVHAPLTHNTRGLIGEAQLAMCKPGVHVVNCARGGIVDEAALLRALESGKVAGAALDVYRVEPPSLDLGPLLAHPRVVCTPHLGASTMEAQRKVALQLATQLAAVLEHRGVAGVVNVPSVQAATNPALLPFVSLAGALGALHAQLVSGKLRQLSVAVHGQDAKWAEAAGLVTAAVVQGLLSQLLEEEVNLGNALAVAHELGLAIVEQRGSSVAASVGSEYRSTISVTMDSDATTRTLCGGVFGGRQPHLLQMDGFPVDVRLGGTMLFFNNRDQPGVLRRVTQVLAGDNVSISHFGLGRHAHSAPADSLTPAYALGVLSTDDPIASDTVQRVAELDCVANVRVVNVPEYVNPTAASPSLPPAGAAPSDRVGADTRPRTRPSSPCFGSGPTRKRPGWSMAALQGALVGRSHRSTEGKARLQQCIDMTKSVLALPEAYEVAIVPGSDTGAFEMAMWNMCGPRPVDVCYWDAFGQGWFKDAQELNLPQVTEIVAPYGELPDLSAANTAEHDVLFTWNGTTSGVRVPDGDWIAADRAGLAMCDATSAVFAMRLPWPKLDVTTYSWQKVLGGEGAHGVMVLSPHALQRLQSYRPPWPVPKLLRMTDARGKVLPGLFEGSTINTPSMLCVEDYLDALQWAQRIGGMDELERRCVANFTAVQEFVRGHRWCRFLARDPATRSPTSVCLALDASPAQVAQLVALLAKEHVAYDIASYRDAPVGLRLWCGATVEQEDLRSLMQWLEWAYDTVVGAADAQQ